MDKRRLIVLAALAGLLIILMVVFFQQGGKDIGSPASGVFVDPDIVDPEITARVTVVLYFLSEDKPNLTSEEREIPLYDSVSLKARRIVNELLSGSQKDLICPFPAETQLREFYLSEKGTAFVDFSGEVRNGHPFGSSADIATVYSLVNTLTVNIEEIKQVVILVEGRESQTLGGHIDLTKPFVYRADMISR